MKKFAPPLASKLRSAPSMKERPEGDRRTRGGREVHGRNASGSWRGGGGKEIAQALGREVTRLARLGQRQGAAQNKPDANETPVLHGLCPQARVRRSTVGSRLVTKYVRNARTGQYA